jgi:hypothetical protein
MAIVWFQRYTNILDNNTALFVREFNESPIIPPGYIRLQQPHMLREDKYDPDISRTREYVWTPQRGKGELISSQDLAEKLVLQFLDLVERDRAGKVAREALR